MGAAFIACLAPLGPVGVSAGVGLCMAVCCGVGAVACARMWRAATTHWPPLWLPITGALALFAVTFGTLISQFR